MKLGQWNTIDLFSGAGGMSAGFHAHPRFRIVGAADGEFGKPSTGFGALQCNSTYAANMGIEPVATDLASVDPEELREATGLRGKKVSVLLACPPCTGFSRVNARNHQVDDPRNSLVGRTALFVEEFAPDIVVMENARELISGAHKWHYNDLTKRLARLGYQVHGSVHLLSRFGLPQQRERAIVIAARQGIELRTMDDLWSGYRIRAEALTVRRAIGHLPPVRDGEVHPSDEMHVATGFKDPLSRERIAAMPPDGGAWIDLLSHPKAKKLLIPAMWRSVEAGTTNHHCDAYGRMWWDKPAPTIKRECCHPGNGRYSHPEQARLCTIREMSLLQGFPRDYKFKARSRKNLYRHIGDAVPPLISFQLAKLAEWMLTGRKPSLDEVLLAGTHLRPSDIEAASKPRQLSLLTG